MGAIEINKKLMSQIGILKRELQERAQSLPAHSIRPDQLLALEEIEGKILDLEKKVGSFKYRFSSQEEI